MNGTSIICIAFCRNRLRIEMRPTPTTKICFSDIVTSTKSRVNCTIQCLLLTDRWIATRHHTIDALLSWGLTTLLEPCNDLGNLWTILLQVIIHLFRDPSCKFLVGTSAYSVALCPETRCKLSSGPIPIKQCLRKGAHNNILEWWITHTIHCFSILPTTMVIHKSVKQCFSKLWINRIQLEKERVCKQTFTLSLTDGTKLKHSSHHRNHLL